MVLHKFNANQTSSKSRLFKKIKMAETLSCRNWYAKDKSNNSQIMTLISFTHFHMCKLSFLSRFDTLNDICELHGEFSAIMIYILVSSTHKTHKKIVLDYFMVLFADWQPLPSLHADIVCKRAALMKKVSHTGLNIWNSSICFVNQRVHVFIILEQKFELHITAFTSWGNISSVRQICCW